MHLVFLLFIIITSVSSLVMIIILCSNVSTSFFTLLYRILDGGSQEGMSI